jgi:hypothetical protein
VLPESGSESGQDVEGPDEGTTPDGDAANDSLSGDAGIDVVDDGQGDASDASDSGDGGAVDGGDACADPNYCATHCAPGIDNCGLQRNCTDNCPSNRTCDPTTGNCTCMTAAGWCSGRCDSIQDNCGNTVMCPMCEGGLLCTSNTCGCVPLPNPCGSQQCGQVLDSCGHPVTCGNNGLCASGGICDADAGTCCTPSPNPCGGRCNVSVDNGCGQMVACPPTCGSPEVCDPTGSCCSPVSCGNSCGTVSNGCGGMMSCGCGMNQVCYSGQCCTPNGNPCSPNCYDNCGQPVACCPEGGPPDGGPDGGSCGQVGAQCLGGQGCCTWLKCTATQTCESSCIPQGSGPCSSLANCCYGATSCSMGVMADGAGPVPQTTMPGMCQ